jgi:hypothetical protein
MVSVLASGAHAEPYDQLPCADAEVFPRLLALAKLSAVRLAVRGELPVQHSPIQSVMILPVWV